MLSADLTAWFELFAGIVVYRPKPDGGHESDGWLNWSDIERRFTTEKLLFGGKQYDPADEPQRELLLNALIRYADTFVMLRLLEKRRQLNPPSLDYKITAFGRKVDNWGYGAKPGFKKSSFFCLAALGLRTYKYKWIFAAGAACWGVLNAIKFYSTALSWAENLPFAAWSAGFVAAILAVWGLIKAKL